MEGTITMEPDTLEVEAGQSDEVETPVDDLPEETEATEPVETESPFEDEDSASKDPVVAKLLQKATKDLEARLTQSFNDRVANERSRAEQQERQRAYAEQNNTASQWRQAESGRELFSLMKRAEALFGEGKSAEEVWQAEFQNVATVAKRIDQAAFTQAFATIQPVANEALLEVFPDYTAPAQLAEKFYGAIHRYDAPAVFKAVMEIAKDAAEKDPKLTAKLESEVKQRTEADKKVTSAQTAAANRSGRTPTLDVPAGGSRKSMTLQQIEDMPMSEWQNIPKEDRTRLLAEAHKRAAR